MSLPNIDFLQIVVIVILSVGGYLAYKSFSGSAAAPKKFKTPLFLFTRRRMIYELSAESRGNIMLPDRGNYGYVERVAAVIIYRYGRVKRKQSPEISESTRKRKQIYVVRENDPAPLEIPRAAQGYAGPPVSRSELMKAEDTNVKAASMLALSEGPPGDATARLVAIGLVISCVVAGLAWILVLLLKVGFI